MKRISVSLALTCALGAPSLAQTVLPTLFAGDGVSSGEVIDIHAEPNDTSPIIAHIPSDSRDIEVVAVDASKAWGRVNHAEASGWLPLERAAEQKDVWKPGELPRGTSCYGTEPFWSLQTLEDSAVFSTIGEQATTLPNTGTFDSGQSNDQRRVSVFEDDALRLTLITSPGLCSDGMSDRAFGLTGHVIYEAGPLPDLLRGCCSIAP